MTVVLVCFFGSLTAVANINPGEKVEDTTGVRSDNITWPVVEVPVASPRTTGTHESPKSPEITVSIHVLWRSLRY